MKMHDYIIAYNFSKDGYLTPCNGTIQISRVKKIKTFRDVNELTKFITEHINVEGVTNLSIYNIIYLGRNKH